MCYALCLWVLVAGNMLFDGCFARAPLDALLALVAAALYLAVTGLVFGMAVGLLAVGWAMVGAWAVLPAAVVPVGVALAVWLGADLLAVRADAVLEALTAHGHTAVRAARAAEVWGNAHDADVVLLDLRMPQMDGVSFLKALRRQAEPIASIPALVTSTEAGPQDIASARQAGANFYLVKPLSQETLIAYSTAMCGAGA